jgi:uncharacterized membrane protein (DUF106 family)
LALKLSIKNRDGNTLLNVPLVLVVLTFLMSFWTVIVLLVMALLTSCQINVYRDKGVNMHNIKQNVKKTVDKIKDKSEEIFKDDEEETEDTDDEPENEIIIE